VIVKDRTFTNAVIFIGFDTYIDCVFIGCTLIIRPWCRGELRHCRVLGCVTPSLRRVG